MRRSFLLPIAVLIFSITYLQSAHSLDRPTQPNWYKADYDLLQNQPNFFLKYQQSNLEYAQSKQKRSNDAMGEILFNSKAFPQFSGYESISSELLEKISRLNASKLEVENLLQAQLAKGKEYESSLKFGYSNIEMPLNDYPNGTSYEDYLAKKIPRATFVSYEVPSYFSSDFSKPIFIKVRIRTQQPVLVYGVIDREGEGGQFNIYEKPGTLNEFRDKYDQDPGTDTLIKYSSSLGAINLIQDKKWNGDIIEETHILRLVNYSKIQFDRITVYIQERSTVDCLKIVFRSSPNLEKSGNTQCLELIPGRPNVPASFGQVIGLTTIERDFNSIYQIHKKSHELGMAIHTLVDYPDQYLIDLESLASRSKRLLQDAKKVESEILKYAVTKEANKKTTINCVKGKVTKKVTAVKPKCPSGYKVKK